jgi:hypothetical protein
MGEELQLLERMHDNPDGAMSAALDSVGRLPRAEKVGTLRAVPPKSPRTCLSFKPRRVELPVPQISARKLYCPEL